MSLSDEILTAYLKVTQHASHQFRLHFGKLDLTFPQALVLNALVEEAPMPVSTLAERTGSANSTVSGIVDRLERLDLVRRERSERDRRVIYVNLTERCRSLRENASTDVKGYFATLLDALSEEEKKSIRDALVRLDQVLVRGEGGLA